MALTAHQRGDSQCAECFQFRTPVFFFSKQAFLVRPRRTTLIGRRTIEASLSNERPGNYSGPLGGGDRGVSKSRRTTDLRNDLVPHARGALLAHLERIGGDGRQIHDATRGRSLPPDGRDRVRQHVIPPCHGMRAEKGFASPIRKHIRKIPGAGGERRSDGAPRLARGKSPVPAE